MNNILLFSACVFLSLFAYVASAQQKKSEYGAQNIMFVNVVADLKILGINDSICVSNYIKPKIGYLSGQKFLLSDNVSYKDESMLYHEFTPHTQNYLSIQYGSIDIDKSIVFDITDVSMLYHELTHIGDCSLSEITLEKYDKSAQHDICSIYPNPASDITKLAYSIEYPSKVIIELFDVMSNCVVNVDAGEKQIGQHNIIIDIQSLTDGVYYCKMNFGGIIIMKKLMIIK